ncbi:Flp family type IVb pilin [Cohnella sp. CFH 77786]|uniref:Flp family type IVb pilin n=1 Tax=Cohnella sp. CFH 77786 TaxID=2662265 RepID=UPI001C60A566|nr:Flp family type IVb pilin [Cohnella sp. CFH 77786]MBW5447512.1 Flp family type IVb pilin [Cohnella sp. CFH 77786]
MMNKMKALVTNEQGQGMTEYGLVLGLIAIAVVGILIALRGQITALFTKANNTISNGVAGLG